MPPKAIYQEIAAGDIDLADRTFDLTPPGLARETPRPDFSPATLALVSPPLLLTVPAGRRMQVLSGWDILPTLPPNSALGCLLLPAETTRATCLELALAAIQTQRPVTPLEQANCWKKAEEWLGSEEAGRRFGPRLELYRRYPPPHLARLLDLPANQAAALQAGRLEVSAAFRLLDLDEKSGALLFQAIALLHLSSSNQKKFLETCLDLVVREGTSIAELLSRPEARMILGGNLVNPPQQAVRLLAWLNELRHPRLHAATRDLQAFTANLSLPKGVSLAPSPSFERDNLRLTIDFRNRTELENCWPALREVLAAKN